MFRQSRYAHVTPADLADVERRIQELEKRLSRVISAASRASPGLSSNVAQATDRVTDAVVSALSEISDRFRGGARSVGNETARLGQDAARLGTQAMRRLSAEVEHRPLVLLAVAVGVGLLIGFAGRRR